MPQPRVFYEGTCRLRTRGTIGVVAVMFVAAVAFTWGAWSYRYPRGGWPYGIAFLVLGMLSAWCAAMNVRGYLVDAVYVLRITSDGVEEGGRFTPWSAIVFVNAEIGAGGWIDVQYVRRWRPYIGHALQLEPRLTADGYRALARVLEAELARSHPHVSVALEPGSSSLG